MNELEKILEEIKEVFEQNIVKEFNGDGMTQSAEIAAVENGIKKGLRTEVKTMTIGSQLKSDCRKKK